MYSKNVHGPDGAGVGSNPSQGDAGTPSERHMMHGWGGRGLKCSFLPSWCFSEWAAGDPSLGAEALHTFCDPTGGHSRWRGARWRQRRDGGDPGRVCAVPRPTEDNNNNKRCRLFSMSALGLPKAGFPPVLSASVFSAKFTISLFCTSLKKKLWSHCKRTRVLVRHSCGWT